MKSVCWAGSLAVVVAVAGSALAGRERVVLKDGSVLTGQVTEKGDSLHIQLDLGAMRTVPKTDVSTRTPLGSFRQEYQARRSKLQPDDVSGMWVLARWCNTYKLYPEAKELCAAILKKDPEHVEAQALLERLSKKAPASKPARRTSAPKPIDRSRMLAPLPRRLTRQEVNRIRLLELRRSRVEDPPPRGRIRPQVIKEFLDEMRGTPGFETDREQRDFKADTFPDQIQRILDLTDTKYVYRYPRGINIFTDPESMAEFKRRVYPLVMRGCGSQTCHGGPNARAFRLITRSSKVMEVWYTNFLILDSYVREQVVARPSGEKQKIVLRMIDRREPELSLLARYCLPTEETDLPHPKVNLSDIPSVCKRDSDHYRAIIRWIRMLQVPRPDYRLKWDPLKPAKPARRGRGQPAPDRQGRKSGE